MAVRCSCLICEVSRVAEKLHHSGRWYALLMRSSRRCSWSPTWCMSSLRVLRLQTVSVRVLDHDTARNWCKLVLMLDSQINSSKSWGNKRKHLCSYPRDKGSFSKSQVISTLPMFPGFFRILSICDSQADAKEVAFISCFTKFKPRKCIDSP